MSNSPNDAPIVSLPLLHDGDALVLNHRVADRHIYLVSIDVYLNNTNTAPTVESFRDLNPTAKRAVINHLNRKYPGKVIHT